MQLKINLSVTNPLLISIELLRINLSNFLYWKIAFMQVLHFIQCLHLFSLYFICRLLPFFAFSSHLVVTISVTNYY